MANLTELNLALACPRGTHQAGPRLFSWATGTPMISQYLPVDVVYPIEHGGVAVTWKLGPPKVHFIVFTIYIEYTSK